jgi:hypothetical protein
MNMRKVLLLATMFAATVCNAQIVLWDGEDESITSRNEFGGWWDRGNPSVVDNPEKDGINPSAKCMKFTMTGNDFGQKHVACPFRDWMTPNLDGGRRVSLMIRKAQNDNVMIELSDPTNEGAASYWEKTAAWYGAEGKWQKVVLDFSTNVNLNDFPGVMGIMAQTGDVNAPQEVWIDNIVIEEPAKVDGKKLTDIADNSLTGEVKVTGSLMRGDCQNTNGDWFRVDYDDFALLLSKLSAEATILDVTEVTLKDPYWDQIQEKCPGITIKLADSEIAGISEVVFGKLLNSNYFTLSGRRVIQPTKGLYIFNGKKLVKK